MSVLLTALLVWLIGVPLGFWLLVAVYPRHLQRMIQRRAASSRPVALALPVSRLPSTRLGSGR